MMGCLVNLVNLDFYRGTPSPFIPLPLGKGEGFFKRGAMPLLNTSYEGREVSNGIGAMPLLNTPYEGREVSNGIGAMPLLNTPYEGREVSNGIGVLALFNSPLASLLQGRRARLPETITLKANL